MERPVPFETYVAQFGVVLSVLLPLFLLPFVIRWIYSLLTNSILGRLTKEKWIEPQLSYKSVFQLILGFYLFGALYLALLLFYVFLKSRPVGNEFPFVLSYYFNLEFWLFTLAYLIGAGTILIQWVWRWMCKKVFPRALAQDVVSAKLSFQTALLIVLALAAIQVLLTIPTAGTSFFTRLLRLLRY